MQEHSKLKIFISYTTIDKEINIDLLLEIEKKLQKFGDIYIDLLHNDNNLEPQKNVINKLTESQLLIVINSKNIKNSEWVKIELEIAKEKNIKTIYINVEDILNDNFEI
ncbi:TIR domain-containing protein [Chryseobacterium arthrosphaerae]|uniref:TIR domain-containing protein n=1 Tax=Chryseobacterium arthrosphaerae TaxID=651561 RepID=UPI001F4B7842|nr:TIR domain-containing protein [Chryseobacterium arthrosphaerae]